MMSKSTVVGLFVLVLVPLLSACGSTRKMGEPIGIEVEADKNANINWGHSFQLRTFLKYSLGGRKEITGKTGLEISVRGAASNNGYVSINSHPSSFQKDTLFVKATYLKRKTTFSCKTSIPFNYKGDLNIQFAGTPGQNGEAGRDGGTSLLFKHGKDGDNGLYGAPGGDGQDLSAQIYKDEESQLYFIRVLIVNTARTFYYTTKDVDYRLIFTLIGGAGGNGGAGGSGGDGKDGVQTEKKVKSAGRGGNGGIGGNAGNGGNGGTAFVFVHPSAKDIVSRILLVNTGGAAGTGGVGGAGGKAGTPLEGQDSKSGGDGGSGGYHGAIGNPGAPIQISVEDFDIDF